MPAQPGFPAFSKIFQRDTRIRTTTASQTRKKAPPKRAPISPPAPRLGLVSSWKAAARSSITPIDHLFFRSVVRLRMPDGRGSPPQVQALGQGGPGCGLDGVGRADDPHA